MLFLKSLILLLAMSTLAFAQTPPEVLHIDSLDLKSTQGKEPRKVIISNSIRDAYLKISYTGTYSDGNLYCNKKFRRRVILTNYKEPVIRLPKAKNCIIKFKNLRDIQLINDSEYSAIYKKFNSYKESCRYQNPGAFYTNNYAHMSCAKPVENIEIMSESKDSFLIKLETLLGYKPSLDLINNQNPYAELDFSKAPELDAIYLSTLLYQNDFSGQLMSRILKYHAKKGTLINIIGTGYMHSDSAKKLLKELSRFSSNIRVQEYKYHEDRFFKKINVLTNYLRDMHVKLFVTLSSKVPEDNNVIIGGRNIHDGFLFDKHPDLSKYPELDQVPLDESFAYWQDFEIKIQSKELAEVSYAHLLKFWNRDLNTNMPQEILSPIHNTAKIWHTQNSTHSFRHILSTPFGDDQALEKLYVELLDSAKSEIFISSPYLRPTPAIMDALKRAIDREIKISIQTRINLEGDTQAWLYEETNKAAINELYDKVKLYEWKENSILHTKLMLIDNNISFVGSVNLSRRSFIQDIESGMLIQSESFNSELRDLLSSYRSKSIQITEEQERYFWAGIVVSLLENQF